MLAASVPLSISICGITKATGIVGAVEMNPAECDRTGTGPSTRIIGGKNGHDLGGQRSQNLIFGGGSAGSERCSVKPRIYPPAQKQVCGHDSGLQAAAQGACSIPGGFRW